MCELLVKRSQANIQTPQEEKKRRSWLLFDWANRAFLWFQVSEKYSNFILKTILRAAAWKRIARLMLCAYLARGGMLRLNVYTASFSHLSPFHLPHLLPGSPREKPCHSGNTLAKDAVRDTAALRATFVSFLIEGWQKQAFVCKSSERLEPETD